MNELFNIQPSLSPRLRWMGQHGIFTEKRNFNEEGDGPWWAWSHAKTEPHMKLEASDRTEDEALTNLAKKLGIKLWNEEGI